MVWYDNVVDEALAAFLVDRGYGGRLRPLSEEEVASPRTEFSRVATPQHVAHWYAAEVEAGRIIPPEQFPPPAVRRQLREAQGLSRPQVAAQLGVSAEALRLWEEGLREPQGANRSAYLSLLASWLSGPQEPPQESESEPEPAGQPGTQPRRDPLTNPSHKEALTAAVRAHRARMARVHGPPASGSWPPTPGQDRSAQARGTGVRARTSTGAMTGRPEVAPARRPVSRGLRGLSVAGRAPA